MKRIVKSVLYCLVLLSLLFAFCGCGGGGNDVKEPSKEEEKLKLNYNAYTLAQYEGFNLSSNYGDTVYTSSDEKIVTVDANGYVFALSVGSASVTAKSGDKTSSCLITVIENGISPYIDTDTDSFQLNVNDEFTLRPELYFSDLITDAVFTYETDSDCITVDANGKVTAIKLGEAGLTVKSIFHNREVTKVINVRVVSDINIFVEESSFSIYKNGSLGGENSFTISGISVYNGNDLIDGAETYYSFDEELLSREGDCFTALNTNGKTVDENTVVSVCYDYEGATYSCGINVKISFPIIDERGKTVYYVDNWKDSLKPESKKIGKEAFSFNYDIFNGNEIKKISSIINGADVDLSYSDGTLGVNNLAKGNFVWKVCGSDYGYMINVSVVDYVCFDSQSLEKILSVATDETIVLGSDILDCGVLTRANQNVFSGVFDGNGHKITNMVLGQMSGGIFYSCNGAVVKNLSFVNVESTARFGSGTEAKEYVRGIIAHTLTNTKLENICIDAFSSSSCFEGVLAYRISQGVSVKNVVINYKTTYTVHGQTTAICSLMDSMFAEADGLYIVCPDTVDLVIRQLQYVDKKEVITSEAFKTIKEMCDFFGVDENDYLIRKYKNNSSLKYDMTETEISDMFDELWEN